MPWEACGEYDVRNRLPRMLSIVQRNRPIAHFLLLELEARLVGHIYLNLKAIAFSVNSARS